METLDKILSEIDSDKHLTLHTTVALDSLGCDIVPKLQKHISSDRRYGSITEDEIWSKIKNGEFSSQIVRKVLIKD
jgi:hypothetical protein|nr:MAG TPA: hypothetical protein [Caudoviricetes sp.]